MGFFSNIFKSNTPLVPVEPDNMSQPMTNAEIHPQLEVIPTYKINLLKEREVKVGISLKKITDEPIQVQVNFIVDVSGSMSSMFNSGKVQQIIERIFPIAMKLDLDKTLNVWTFNSSGYQIDKSVTMNNFDGYIKKYINNISGSTSYSPVMKKVIDFYKKDLTTPILNIMITDGENDDRSDAESYIKQISNKNHFWSFVGIGDEDFRFLKKLDTLTGRTLDNASFFAVDNMNNMSDEKLYDSLLSEFPTWISEAKKLNIVK